MPICTQCKVIVSVRQAADLHKKLFENANSDWRANDIAQKVAEEKQREMDLLLNRYRYLPRSRCFGSALVTVSASDPKSLNPDLDPGFLVNSDQDPGLLQLKKKSVSETLVTMQCSLSQCICESRPRLCNSTERNILHFSLCLVRADQCGSGTLPYYTYRSIANILDRLFASVIERFPSY